MPYEYLFSIASAETVDVELFDCGPGSEGLEGMVVPTLTTLSVFTSAPRKSSPDGVTYAGSETVSQPQGGVTQTWSFTGTE